MASSSLGGPNFCIWDWGAQFLRSMVLIDDGMDLLYRIGIPHPVGWRILIAGGLLLGFLGTYLWAAR